MNIYLNFSKARIRRGNNKRALLVKIKQDLNNFKTIFQNFKNRESIIGYALIECARNQN